MTLLSILIPAYNAEQFLPRCLDSICGQDMAGTEVVIVDDGSTDGTLVLAQRYSHLHDNIRTCSKPNEGVGATRNRLLQEAKGEYVWFVDADDYVHEGCIPQICLALAEAPDTDMMTVLHDEETLHGSFEGSGEDYIVQGRFDGYLWSKIIKRSAIETNHIRFEADLCSQEDWLFLMQLYPMLRRVKTTHIMAYHYCDDNQNSVMRKPTRENIHRNVDNSLKTICHFGQLVSKYQGRRFCPAYRAWLNYSVSGFLFSLLPLDYTKTEVRAMLQIFRKKGLYPVGKTHRKKADLFLLLANREWVYLLLVNRWKKISY